MLGLTAGSEKMYKTKITQWGLMKNYKAAEKEHLARIVKAHRESGEGTPLLTLRNRAAKMSRVRRFCKQQKILEEICDALPTESSSNKEIPSSTEESPPRSTATTGVLVSALQGVQTSLVPSVPTLTKISFNPERPFSTASKDGRIELILLQMKIYFEYRFAWARKSDKWTSVAQPASQNAGNAADNVNTWRDKLVFGVGALVNQKSAQGWRLLDEACRIFHQVLDQQSQSLFENLFHAFTDSDWTTYRDISTHLLRFFTKVSVTRFGCNHPISIILYHLQEHQILTDAVTPAFEILMDVFGENGNPTDEEIWSIKANYCLLLTNRGDYAAAESYATRSLKQCGEVYGRLHWRTRMHLLELGDVYYCQSLYEPAERQYKDILQRGREDLGHEFPDDECIFALQHSAWICEERGDFAQSEDYWRAVLAGAIINWSMEDERATYLIAELEKSLKYHGMDPEAWLQQNFGISCV
jgi:tetratricopeptide (TPR) repeat protein